MAYAAALPWNGFAPADFAPATWWGASTGGAATWIRPSRGTSAIMVGAALSVLAALVVGARAAYPRILERRARRRLELGAEGIVDGAASIDLFRDGAPGALLLHGGGDTPQVLAELAAHLHAAGLSVRVPLLSGHGRDLSALTTTSSKEWHADAEREYDRMRVKHRWVAVVGLSMGGALAVNLASKRQDIPALVLLAPYVVMPRALR